MTLKVAIASFAHTHAAGYAYLLGALPDVEVLSADPDGASAPDAGPRGAAFAEQLGIPYVDSYDELFAWGPDAVVVTSENAGHRALVERAAAVGAHVLCEKPLATRSRTARRCSLPARPPGSILMVAYPVRFSPSYVRLRAKVEAGRARRLSEHPRDEQREDPVRPRQWFTDAKLAGGGALVDHTVHCADLIDGLTGGRGGLACTPSPTSAAPGQGRRGGDRRPGDGQLRQRAAGNHRLLVERSGQRCRPGVACRCR